MRSQLGRLVAGLYPTTGLPELSVAADYAAWAFALHDAGNDTPVTERPAELGELFERFEAVFRGEGRGARLDVVTQALESIVDRLALALSTEQLEGFAQANRIYFAGMHWRATNRAAASVPDEQEYTLLGPAASPVQPCLALIEPLERIRLTSAMHRNRAVAAMGKLAGRMVCWVDDVFSYEEESRLGEVHNLALVYEVHRQLRPGSALTAAVRRHNADAAEFTEYATSLPSFGFSNDVELRHYVKVLESTMRATFEWTRGGGRDGVHTEERAAMVG